MEKTRLLNLGKEIRKAGIGGVLICPSEELLFLSGFTPMICERFQGLFVTAKDEYFYICNLLYQGEIKQAYKDEIPIFTWKDGESMTAVVAELMEDYQLKNKAIAVNSSAQAFNILDIARDCGVTFINGLRLLEEARIIKTEEEKDNLRQSAKIVDEVFKQALVFLHPGQSEAEVSAFLQAKMVEAGGTKPWSIAASGPNSSYPHYTGDQRIIEEQDILIMDFGCVYNGMYSDTTRTVFFGDITDKQREIYQYVLAANKAGEAAAVNGAYIPDVDSAARSIIEKAGYGADFITRLGHGIGYMIHEAPDIKKNNERSLQAGMAFSIEPGIYLSGDFGVRIEDIVLVSEDGNEILNKSSKEIIIL